MSPRVFSAEQLGLETAKVLAQARKAPVLIRVPGKGTLVLRPVVDDDVAEGLFLQNRRFRASIRRARRNRAAGKSVALDVARRLLS